jgi:presenilin-like A22 family membrane protease
MKNKKLIPIFGIGALLLLSQFLALLIAKSFSELGLTAFEEPSDPTNLLTILVAIALITLLFLFIATRKRKGFQKLLQVIIFFALWMLLYYGLFAILFRSFPPGLDWIVWILSIFISTLGI